MATDALEMRMARLEGAYEQINERLGGVERALVALREEFKSELRAEIGGVRAEMRSEIGGLRSEVGSEIGGLRSEVGDLRRQMQTQFYWTLTLILTAILIPLLRDLPVR